MVLTPLALSLDIMPSKSGNESRKTSKFPIVPVMVLPNQYRSKITASTGTFRSLNLLIVFSTSYWEWYPNRLAKFPNAQRGGIGCFPVKLVYWSINLGQVDAATIW